MIKNFCDFNLTYIIVKFKINNYLDFESGFISGKLSAPLHHFLGKNKRCKLIGAESFGEKTADGNYTGALKLLNENAGDMVFVAQPYYFAPEFFDFSPSTGSASYVISHPIKNSSFSKTDLNIINVVTLDYYYFLTYIFLNFIVYLFISVQIKSILKRRFKTVRYREFVKISLELIVKSLINGFCNFKSFKIPFFGLIIFTIYILTVFTKILIANSFRTSKILIDTDEIIHNERLLFQSNKYICWIESEPSLMLARNSPKGSLLEKILRFKNLGNCYFDMSAMSYETFEKFESNGFILSAYFFAFCLISEMLNLEKKLFWISESFYELVIFFPIRRSLDGHKKRLLNDKSSIFIENGIQTHMYYLSINLVQNYENLKFLFDSLEKFKNQNTKLIQIDFESLKILFQILLVIECAVVTLFFIKLFIRNNRS